jgi:hypothetical protein
LQNDIFAPKELKGLSRVLKRENNQLVVIPAKAGNHNPMILLSAANWIPAFAGMTMLYSAPCLSRPFQCSRIQGCPAGR